MDGEPAVPDGRDLGRVGEIERQVEEDIIKARADNTAEHHPDDEVHHLVRAHRYTFSAHLALYDVAAHQYGDYIHEAVEAYLYEAVLEKYGVQSASMGRQGRAERLNSVTELLLILFPVILNVRSDQRISQSADLSNTGFFATLRMT